jgi:hypothetical protein
LRECGGWALKIVESGADQKHFGQENHQLIILRFFSAMPLTNLGYNLGYNSSEPNLPVDKLSPEPRPMSLIGLNSFPRGLTPNVTRGNNL